MAEASDAAVLAYTADNGPNDVGADEPERRRLEGDMLHESFDKTHD